MVSAQIFRRVALGLEGVVERAHMGHPDFRVRDRIFATLRDHDTLGMVVLAPEEQQAFIRDHARAFEPESGAWGRQGCTRVRLDEVDEDTLGEAMTLAWRLAASNPPGRSRAGTTSSGKRSPAPANSATRPPTRKKSGG